ncbi:hypothetical protein C8R45DRAFT_1107226 [Mycena sanguinolenta]|nr:hypothetical protein C8R45DRAFT_1107226 [Mycena sanguinolenta]
MDTTLTARRSLIPLDNTLGAWFIGLILSCCVFGISLLQVYLYYTKYSPRDGMFLKSFVGVLIVVDGFNVALIAMAFYNFVVTNFGDYTALGQPPWSLILSPFICLGAVILSIRRRKFLSGHASNSTNISPPGMGIVYTHKTIELANAAAREGIPFSADSLLKLEVASLSVEMFCDLVIAGGMVYTLLQNKSEFGRTNRAIDTLVTYTVKSGVLNLVFAICCLFTWVAWTGTLIYTPFFFVLGRLYGCSFLSLLNSRDHIREQMTTGGATSHAMLTFPSSSVRADSILTGDNSQIQSTGPVVFRGDTKSYV